MVKDRKDEERLPRIRDETAALDDIAFDKWINDNSIHRDCHWQIDYDHMGKKSARIVCEFRGSKKKVNYLIR